MHEPTIKETAFDCPHCGAYTTQYWHNIYIKFISKDPKVPLLPADDFEKRIVKASDLDKEHKEYFLEYFNKLRSKIVFTKKTTDYGEKPQLHNVYASQCYNCKKWALWVNEDIVYPDKKFGVQPNQDLPQDILMVVEEARSILDKSPKWSAALLRLAIQTLCRHLGESGENLNKDIANLVKKGLNPIVQKSLDVVRVIGNEAVHPGVIDLNDNRDIAIRLFDLINIISDQMITHPKHVHELYEKLPESKRKAIAKRDGNNSR